MAAAQSGDEIREALVIAAGEVFAEQGYSGARVQSIAERAGLTTGAIYNRFSGKSELLLEALDSHTADLLESLAEADVGVHEILEVVGVALLGETGAGSTLLLEAFMAARREEGVADRLGPRLANERARLATLIDTDKSTGRVSAALDTEAIVTFCQSVALGVRMLNLMDTPMPSSQSWRELIATLLRALEPGADTPADSA